MRSIPYGLGILAATVVRVAAQQTTVARNPVVVVSQRTGQFNGVTVRYTATVAETFLTDSAATPQASVVTFSYLRTDVTDRTARPVLFAFNGGPGASSTPLHLGAFGPLRRTSDRPDQRMIANPDSPLDAVDLVFIDPVGTGYSHPFPGVDGRQYWSRTGDALSVKAVIADWLKRNGRERSPRYLLGQSYGTTRAALILKYGSDLEFDGVLLFALDANVSGLEMPFVSTLPAFAATAWYHDRIARDGRTLEQVHDEAAQFARSEYVTALIRGSSLPAADHHRIALRMAALIGLPVDLIEANDLRISRDTFMFDLLQDRGLRTGQLDGRATARLDAPPQRPPYDDPGLNYRPPSPGDSANVAGSTALPFNSAAPDAYFKTQLGFHTIEVYNALNLDVNAAWDHEGFTDVIPEIGAAMRRNPKLRVFWVAGYYDITTPVFAGRYGLDQAGIPGDRLTAVVFPAGHSVFTEEQNLAALAAAVRKFVAAP